MLVGKDIVLRSLTLDDLDFLFSIENNTSYFKYSDNPNFYSKEDLIEFISNSTDDILKYNQIRFVIENDEKPIGFIDLFDYNKRLRKAGIGIIIIEDFQNMGYGTESLKLLISYCWKKLDLLHLYANIKSSNIKSIKLFEKLGFKQHESFLFLLSR